MNRGYIAWNHLHFTILSKQLDSHSPTGKKELVPAETFFDVDSEQNHVQKWTPGWNIAQKLHKNRCMDIRLKWETTFFKQKSPLHYQHLNAKANSGTVGWNSLFMYSVMTVLVLLMMSRQSIKNEMKGCIQMLKELIECM